MLKRGTYLKSLKLFNKSQASHIVIRDPCFLGKQRLCYENELKTACSNLGGQVWNKHYCIIPDYYTVVGPVCWGPSCFSSTSNICDTLNGESFKWWCLVKGCDKYGTSSCSFTISAEPQIPCDLLPLTIRHE